MEVDVDGALLFMW